MGDCRTVYNKELLNLSVSQTIINQVMKSRRMRWVGLVDACETR
jgi:hypothetical protein